MNALIARWSALRKALLDELTPSVRALVLWLILAGVLFLALGIALDLAGATRDYPFAVSMLSSATAASFGIPVALVAVRHLQRGQEALAKKAEVAGLAASAAEWILASMERYVRDRSEFDAARSCFESLRLGLERGHQGVPAPWTIEANPEELRKLARDLREGVRHFRKAVLDEDARTQLRLTVNNRWAYLYDHLRPQLYETGSRWIFPGAKAFFLVRFGEEADILARRDGQLPDPFARLRELGALGVERYAETLETSADAMERGLEFDRSHFDHAINGLEADMSAYYEACRDYNDMVLYLRGVRDSLAQNLQSPPESKAGGDSAQ